MNLNNPDSEVSGFPVADDLETNDLQYEKPAMALKTPKEFDFNNPGPDGYRDNPGTKNGKDKNGASGWQIEKGNYHAPQN